MKHAKRRLKCPNCGSIDTRRHSKIRTKENGVHSRWYCKSCKCILRSNVSTNYAHKVSSNYARIVSTL